MARFSFREVAAGIKASIERHTLYIESRIVAISLIASVCFPLYYFVWRYIFPQPYENLLLRLLGSLIFIPLVLISRWPHWLFKYRSIYWYGATLYTLPFFFIFMLLKNDGSDIWRSSVLVALFLMLLWMDWINVIIQLILGGILAVIFYYLTTDSPHLTAPSLEYIPIYLFAIVVGIATNIMAEILRQERLRTMLTTVGNIAHELRTPLLGIKTGAAGLRQYLPALMDGYMRAKELGLAVQPIRQIHLDAMRGVLERIEGEASHSNTVIDMLLMNVRQDEATPQTEVVGSISQCVQTALARYPFSSDKERELVVWEGGPDFSFRGNELLMVHVLFNLLKNSLYHVAKAGKGDVIIRLERGAQGNLLRFRDSGSGIPPEVLPNIFTRFYSWSSDRSASSGAGVGLAFCRSVMSSFGGKIAAESALGEYTEFVLTFPNEGAA